MHIDDYGLYRDDVFSVMVDKRRKMKYEEMRYLKYSKSLDSIQGFNIGIQMDCVSETVRYYILIRNLTGQEQLSGNKQQGEHGLPTNSTNIEMVKGINGEYQKG